MSSSVTNDTQSIEDSGNATASLIDSAELSEGIKKAAEKNGLQINTEAATILASLDDSDTETMAAAIASMEANVSFLDDDYVQAITPDTIVVDKKMESISTQFWRNGYFYSFAQENKFQYESFVDVKKDSDLLNKFIKYIDSRNKATLPGQKELLDLENNVISLDSTDTIARKALNTLSDFYNKKIAEKTKNESEQKLETPIKEINESLFKNLFRVNQ